MNRIKRSLPVRVVQAYGKSGASNYAAGLAFNAFLAMFPVILGVLSIIGLVVQDPGIEHNLHDAIVGIFPSDAQDQVRNALEGVKSNAGLLAIVSLVGLLWSGTGLFAAMEFALTQIFGTKQRDTIRQRLMGLIMMVIFLVAIIVAVGANNLTAILPLMPFTGIVIGLAALFALLLAIYRFVPNRTFTLREIWPGAVLGAVVIEIFTLAFPLYSQVTHGFNTYGQEFALFFLLAAWLLFLSQFILAGAVFNNVRLGEPHAEGIIPAPPSKEREPAKPGQAVEDAKEVSPEPH